MKAFKSLITILLFFLFATIASGQETGGVKGKVRNEKGKKIPNVVVTLQDRGKDLKSTKTGKDGKFIIRGIKPGKYNLVFEKEGYSLGVLRNVFIKRKKTNNLKDRLILTVDDGTLVIVRGSVFNQNGLSIRGAKILIEDIGSKNKKPEIIGKGYTSQSGEFVFRFDEGIKKLKVTASAGDVSKSKELSLIHI